MVHLCGMTMSKNKTIDDFISDVGEEEIHQLREAEFKTSIVPVKLPAKKEPKEIVLTDEEMETGEIEIKGVPDNLNLEKLIKKALAKDIIKLAKRGIGDDDENADKKRAYLIQALHAVKTDKKQEEDTGMAKTVKKELENSSAEEILKMLDTLKKAKTKKKE